MSEPICQTCHGTGIDSQTKEPCEECPICEWCSKPAPEFERLVREEDPDAVACLECWDLASNEERVHCAECGVYLSGYGPHHKGSKVCRRCGNEDAAMERYYEAKYGDAW